MRFCIADNTRSSVLVTDRPSVDCERRFGMRSPGWVAVSQDGVVVLRAVGQRDIGIPQGEQT